MPYWTGSAMSREELRGLSNHKYSSSSSSLLDPWLQPWWTWVVALCPMWVAPNLITVIGLLINIVTASMVVYFAPTAKETVPWWASLMCALGLFLYQTLDAIDGKQARRTGTSSPLGELFDHGCDSLSTVVVISACSCCLGMGHQSLLLLTQCLFSSAMFYLSHYEAYMTGTMRFGKFDVTEAQISMMAIMIVTSSFGSDIWNVSILNICDLRLLPVAFAYSMAVISLLTTLRRFYKRASSGGRTIADTNMWLPSLPLLFVSVSCYFVAFFSREQVFDEQPLLYAATFSLIVAKFTNRLIVAHMCKSEMSVLDITLIVPVVLVLNVFLPLAIPEKVILIVAVIFVFADLLLYSKAVCLDICRHMGVKLFTIPYNKAS